MNRPPRDRDAMVWLLVALAAEWAPLGFSPNGALYSWAEVRDHQARVMTIDVARSTWNHLPVEADGDDAVQVARSRVKPGYAVVDGVAGEALPILRDGPRDHTHAAPHVTAWTVRTAQGTGTATLTESPAPACHLLGAVEPSLTWTPPTGPPVALLADRNPPRWAPCALSWELAEVRAGPRGALVFVLRGLWLEGDEVVYGYAVGATR